MLGWLFRNSFLAVMALLEYGQAAVDVVQGNYARALIMACAGTSSIAFAWVM